MDVERTDDMLYESFGVSKEEFFEKMSLTELELIDAALSYPEKDKQGRHITTSSAIRGITEYLANADEDSLRYVALMIFHEIIKPALTSSDHQISEIIIPAAVLKCLKKDYTPKSDILKTLLENSEHIVAFTETAVESYIFGDGNDSESEM